MVIDSSALVAAPAMMEASMVVLRRTGEGGQQALRAFCTRGAVDIVAFRPEPVDLAIDAFRRFDKGRHKAGLNFGNRFSDALATATSQPLLFKGEGFSQTDIRPALCRPALCRPVL